MEKIVLTDLSQIDWSILPKDAKAIAFDDDGEGMCSTTDDINIFSPDENRPSGMWIHDGPGRWLSSPYDIDTSKIDWRESKVARPEVTEAEQDVEIAVGQKRRQKDGDLFLFVKELANNVSDSVCCEVRDMNGKLIRTSLYTKEYLSQKTVLVKDDSPQKTIKQIVAEKMTLNDEKVPAPFCSATDIPQPGQFGSFYNNEIDEGRLSILGGIVENGFRNQAGFFYKHFNPISAFDLFELLKKAPDFGEWQKAQVHNQEPQPIQQVKKVSEIQALAETGKGLSASIMYGNKPVRYARDIKLLGED